MRTGDAISAAAAGVTEQQTLEIRRGRIQEPAFVSAGDRFGLRRRLTARHRNGNASIAPAGDAARLLGHTLPLV